MVCRLLAVDGNPYDKPKEHAPDPASTLPPEVVTLVNVAPSFNDDNLVDLPEG